MGRVICRENQVVQTDGQRVIHDLFRPSYYLVQYENPFFSSK